MHEACTVHRQLHQRPVPVSRVVPSEFTAKRRPNHRPIVRSQLFLKAHSLLTHTHTPIHQTVGKNTQQQETPEPWYRCLGSWCFAPDVWRVFVLLCAITTSAPERDGSAARVKKLWTAGGLMMGWSLLPFFILLLLFFPFLRVFRVCVCVYLSKSFFPQHVANSLFLTIVLHLSDSSMGWNDADAVAVSSRATQLETWLNYTRASVLANPFRLCEDLWMKSCVETRISVVIF